MIAYSYLSHASEVVSLRLPQKIVEMDANSGSVRSLYYRLKKAFRDLSGLLNVHLEDALLHDMGVDFTQIDLEEETDRGGPYFLPMSQACMDSLDKRRGFSLAFDDEMSDSIWDFWDANIIHREFQDQIYYNNDESTWQAWQRTHWQPRLYVLFMIVDIIFI